MVALDQDLMFATFEVVSSLLHCHHDRQQFTVVRVVVLLGGRALPRVERCRSKDTEAVKLIEDTCHLATACVCLKSASAKNTGFFYCFTKSWKLWKLWMFSPPPEVTRSGWFASGSNVAVTQRFRKQPTRRQPLILIITRDSIF
jgi:hypothetical protein